MGCSALDIFMKFDSKCQIVRCPLKFQMDLMAPQKVVVVRWTVLALTIK